MTAYHYLNGNWTSVALPPVGDTALSLHMTNANEGWIGLHSDLLQGGLLPTYLLHYQNGVWQPYYFPFDIRQAVGRSPLAQPARRNDSYIRFEASAYAVYSRTPGAIYAALWLGWLEVSSGGYYTDGASCSIATDYFYGNGACYKQIRAISGIGNGGFWMVGVDGSIGYGEVTSYFYHDLATGPGNKIQMLNPEAGWVNNTSYTPSQNLRPYAAGGWLPDSPGNLTSGRAFAFANPQQGWAFDRQLVCPPFCSSRQACCLRTPLQQR